jgi:hypothetical protein
MKHCSTPLSLSEIERIAGAGEAELPATWLDAVRRAGSQGEFTLLRIPCSPAAGGQPSQHLVWWPGGVPEGRAIGLVSSRMPRAWDQFPGWFEALRYVCGRIEVGREWLLVVEGTTVCPFASRAATLFAKPLVRLSIDETIPTVPDWLAALSQRANESSRSPRDNAAGPHGIFWKTGLVSPPLSGAAAPTEKAPLRDRILISAADRLWLLHVRRGGYSDRLVRERLRRHAVGEAYLLLDMPLSPRKLVAELLELGAVGWIARRDSAPEAADETCNNNPAAASTMDSPRHPGPWRSPILDWRQVDWGQMLTHCTRRQYGPWMDQAVEEYLDELILGLSANDRSALAALLRIVTTRRLLSASRTVRGTYSVVSFTAAGGQELANLRTFRGHRARWDFEPYGISIARSWLEERGARPVIYGDERTWSQLSVDDRPFFQKQRGRGAEPIDWSVEREWRHVGDLDLGNLRPEDACLLVPSFAEAARVAAMSPWKVVVVD